MAPTQNSEEVREITIKRREGEGLGLSLIQQQRVTIGEIVKDSAGDAAGGLLKGDLIVAVNGTTTDKVDSDAVVQMIKDAGDDIVLSVTQPVEVEEPVRTVVIKRAENEKLGLQVLKTVATLFNRISGINENSAAAGVEDVKLGDRLRSINGVEITTQSHEEVVSMLSSAGAEVTLGLQSDASPYTKAESPANMLEKRTVSITKATGGYGLVLGSDGGTKGVRVDTIAPGSPAADAGLKTGDVILEINGVSALEKTHEEVLAMFAETEEAATITVQHPSAVAGASRYVTISKDPAYGFEFVSAQGGYPTITSLLANGAAAKSGGILVGDKLISVNGVSLATLGHDEVVDLLQQSEQATLELQMSSKYSDFDTTIVSSREIQISRVDSQAIGLRLTSNMADVPGLVITGVMPASPAADAGARTGEILVSINGAPLKDLSHDDITDMLSKAPTPVAVEVGTIPRLLKFLRDEYNLSV